MADPADKRSAASAPAASVVVPTFQRRELVERAIASALAQSRSDLELIVVDDGSADGTREAVERIAAADPRVRYHWQPNRGVAAARNAGIRMARGELVAFLDSDDRWLPDHLEVTTGVLDDLPEAVLASTCPNFALAGGERIGDARLVDYREELLTNAAAVGFMPCITIRRVALEAVGWFDERLEAMEDSDLLRRLAIIGPFALIRRRTVLAQTTAGSLRDRSRASGGYLRAGELSAENLVSAVEKLPEPERARLDGEARGHLHLARALLALDRGDREGLRAELASAHPLLPISDKPGMIDFRLTRHLPGSTDAGERLRLLRIVLAAWPDADSRTAHHLRAWAIALSLRLRRFPAALRLLAGWPATGTADFAAWAGPELKKRIRRAIQDRRHRGSETGTVSAIKVPSTAPPAVSVVLPTHQRRELVRQAIAGALAQSRSDLELIVVDDGSADGTREAVERIAAADPRVRYHWQPNRGVAAARNAGIRMARGELVAFLDSDNLWRPDHLEIVCGALERDPEADLGFSGDAAAASGAQRRLDDPVGASVAGNVISRASSAVVRREALLAAGGFHEDLSVAEDADLWMRLALRGTRFVGVPGATVTRRSVPGSLIADRKGGEYAAALRAGTERAISELRSSPESSDDDRMRAARGRLALSAALTALALGDEDEAQRALADAWRLLPELAAPPRRMYRHIRYDLPGSASRLEVAGRLATAAQLWPDPSGATARSLRAEAALELALGGRVLRATRLLRARPAAGRRSPMVDELMQAARMRAVEASRRFAERLRGARAGGGALQVQRFVLRTGFRPLRPLWRAAYEASARLAAAYLTIGTAASAYVRGSLTRGDAVPGVSDIDLSLAVPSGEEGDAAARRVDRRWWRLRAALPTISRALLEPPRIHRPEELRATTLLHGLRPGNDGESAVEPSRRERLRASGGAERPGLYGPCWDWRHLRGRDRLGHLRLWSRADDLRPAAWMELQYWWLQAFRAAAAPDAPWRRLLCAKLISEPGRVSLWLSHGERFESRDELIERCLIALPRERDALRAAREWHRAPARAPDDALEQALPTLVRLSAGVAGGLGTAADEAGWTEVRLRWGGPESLIVGPSDGEAVSELPGEGAATRLLPLMDWRARAWPPAPPDETFAVVGDRPTASVLREAAAASSGSAIQAAIRAHDLLILPSLKRARLRAVQCAVTDPVSFALVQKSDRAHFPDLPGWSVRDSARRAVAEHLGWLRDPAEFDRSDAEALGRLFSAARANQLLEGVRIGAPELDLTAAATAGRLAERSSFGTVAEHALGELRASRLEGASPSGATVAAFREAVTGLPAYSAARGH